MERKKQTGHVCRWMDFLHNDCHLRRRMYHSNSAYLNGATGVEWRVETQRRTFGGKACTT